MSDTGARTFEELIAEAEAASVDGWDFSWLDGRATEERPEWRYARLLADRLSRATAALDLQTGGGEVLAEALAGAREAAGGVAGEGARPGPALTVATESWPPNIARATALLHPLGVALVADQDEPPLPFGDAAFDLVVSRHPVRAWWDEIARVLRPGGTYLSQEVGPASVFELVEYFLGPMPPEIRSGRDPDRAMKEAEAAGLDVVDLRTAALRTEFRDIGAVVYFLRKVIWMVPGFTVERYRDQLLELHRRIASDGPFVATTTRFLIEAVKPA
ncbi:methyltransferase domain-containing protein [Streptomyces liangshanensis]|uniref:Class I SAM-dependent methyltransferase n=1 Tax=Streptomyces liangshanensis TaxID=2717324 RepID=A0A6G9GXH1_9ACTN|nr:methyltransferase domain-containing protein [Streptomyces liangshanensis]QIQ02910.1 class I SAM-dependent methyltransferase [Streptomyces liangshanensis]